ncbi:hypothetical protein [Priestia koreensis]|uniref:hypothetical protein n=1 Tax=Priestia koreensis TaxID=284581 RepID=UPI000A850132|nr:hypothetical protein [Priestia koreensis]
MNNAALTKRQTRLKNMVEKFKLQGIQIEFIKPRAALSLPLLKHLYPATESIPQK